MRRALTMMLTRSSTISRGSNGRVAGQWYLWSRSAFSRLATVQSGNRIVETRGAYAVPVLLIGITGANPRSTSFSTRSSSCSCTGLGSTKRSCLAKLVDGWFSPGGQMKPKVYLETTIASYLTARTSRDLVVAAHQELTAEWWNQHRNRFSLFVSGLVLQEAGGGDPGAAAGRLAELRGIAVLELNDDVRELARRFLESGLIPAKAVEDAFHVAIATLHGMDYLLTWNC